LEVTLTLIASRDDPENQAVPDCHGSRARLDGRPRDQLQSSGCHETNFRIEDGGPYLWIDLTLPAIACEIYE
jgi:hypothetical protein